MTVLYCLEKQGKVPTNKSLATITFLLHQEGVIRDSDKLEARGGHKWNDPQTLSRAIRKNDIVTAISTEDEGFFYLRGKKEITYLKEALRAAKNKTSFEVVMDYVQK